MQWYRIAEKFEILQHRAKEELRNTPNSTKTALQAGRQKKKGSD